MLAMHIVAFMTGPLVHRPLRLRPGNFRGPGSGPRGGIFNRKLVQHRVVRHAREAFHQMQLLAGSLERAQAREIRGVDHQSIPFPAPHRVALIQTDVLGDMRAAVGRDHARGVVGLAKHGHVSRSLHNLYEVALVGARDRGILSWFSRMQRSLNGRFSWLSNSCPLSFAARSAFLFSPPATWEV